MNLLPNFCQSQSPPPLKFEHFTGEKALNHGEINSIMKDSKGFLWISTYDGLNRYDGYDLKMFRNNPDDTTTICSGWVGALAEDHHGDIWVATNLAYGLNCYNQQTGKFKRYSGARYVELLPISINQITVDRFNRLWMVSDAEGIFVFDPKTEKTIVFAHDSLNTESLQSNETLFMSIADNNHFYVSSPKGIDLIEINSGKCKHYQLQLSEKFYTEYIVNCFIVDHEKKLWICTNDGLKMFDPATEKVVTYRHDKQNPFSISSDSLSWACETPDGNLWITNGGGTLNFFDHKQNKFFVYHPQTENPAAFFSHQLLYDPSGKLWIISDFTIDAVNLLPEKFRVFTHDDQDKNSLVWNQVQYIYQDHHDKVFVGTYHALQTFDPVTQSFELYQPDPALNKIFSNEIIDFIFQDEDDNYWFEASNNKLIFYNPHSHRSVIHEFKEPHHPDSLGIGYIWDAYQDPKGLIWFVGEMHVCSFNPATNKFKSYLKTPEQPDDYFANLVTRVFPLKNGKLILTGTGLAYFDSLNHRVVMLKFKDRAANIFEWQKGNIICQKRVNDSVYWLSTMGQGLYLLNFETGASRHFSIADGLPSNLIWGILTDARGNLWLATNNGLCKFTPPKNLFDENSKASYRIYNTNDGLPVNEFGWNGYCQLRDGAFLLTTTSSTGLISFHPDSLKDNPFVPPVYITKFSLFNKEVIPSDTNKFLRNTIETTKEITLSYRENVFSFTFAALNFVHPENNHYAYKLEGFDKDWIYTNASKRFANYTNLDAGDYTFLVKGSNNDCVWNETPTTLHLIITPPYWLTWWFRILMIALLGGIIYALVRNRLNQILKLQRIRNKIASDLHDDVGSTLSSISIFSELAKQQSKEVTPLLNQIGENARNMLDTMADIVWTINPENDNFEKIILRMQSFAYNLLGAKNIAFEFDADESISKLKLPMEVRKNLFLIFKEAANNMAKYSEASRALFSIKYSNRQIKFLIRDNGKGFNEITIEKGNGLKNMRKRAKEIGAQLLIESGIGSGTSVELILKT